MGAYSLEVLIRKWSLEELTAEQAIGQMLLMFQELCKRMENVERNNGEGRGHGFRDDSRPTLRQT